MAGTATTRIISFVLLVASSALCQPSTNTSSLPDAPSPQKADREEGMRGFSDTARLPATTMPIRGVLELKYDPFHFQEERIQKDGNDLKPWMPLVLKRTTPFRGLASTTFFGRVTDAASGIVLTRDDEGRRKLNTPYLLRVLTVATAHVADRPYWRRSVGQPFSDVGSTLGNDAGMSVLHAFQPDLMQIVKTHEPRFVSRIEQRVRQK